jgi:translocator protein
LHVNKQTLAATTLAVGATAGIGSVASKPRITRWYSRLQKPPYVPPNEVFPVAWTTLYADFALAANLILNAGWSWLFFKYQKLGASAVGAAVLAASSADLTRRTVAADRRAGIALLPYALWCSFATLMSGHIWVLNRR